MLESIGSAFRVIGLLFFFAYFGLMIASGLTHQKKDRCHLRNSYPYEIYMTSSVIVRICLSFFLAVSVLSMAFGGCVFFLSFKTFYMNVVAVVLPLSFVCLLIGNFLSLEYYKSHLFFSFAGFLLYATACLLVAISSVVSGATFLDDGVPLPFAVIFGVLGGGVLFSLINPKLMDWAKMDKAEENGKVFYVKPKVNFLALYEWICLGLIGATDVILMIYHLILLYGNK